ncbi:MAG: alpha/beta hydrolase [Solirubrobacterales bacterium]|nr:alpha/beta hydrolase [Solirubrobacterales bacterium]
MSRIVEGAGVEIAYQERGSGPTVVLVHGVGDCGKGGQAIAAPLASRARVVTYDRRGYGGSGSPQPYGATTVQEQAEDLAALIEAVGVAPVVLCGFDFGALICLDLSQRHRELVAGMVLVDPPVFAFVDQATEALSAQRLALEQRMRDDGASAAIEGHLRDCGYDAVRCARGALTPRAFFADYAGLATLEIVRRDLRGLDIATLILSTTRAAPHERAAAKALAPLFGEAALEQESDDVVGAVLSLIGSR